MKKLIAILTIAIVLVGAVFATDPINGDTSDGTGKVVVTAVVSEQHPLFQIKTTSTTDTAGVSAIGKVSQSIATTDPADPSTGSVTLTTDYLVNNDSATVSFSIGQINRSSSTAKYYLTVTAAPLKRVADPAGTAVSTYNAATEVFPLAEGDEAPEITRRTVTGITIGAGTTTNIMSLQYSGATITPTNNYLELGVFSVTWTKNANALAGTYTADVTLEVEAY